MRPTPTVHEPHRVWPTIHRRELEDGAYSLYNAGHGTSLDVEPESDAWVQRVLAGFAQPTSLGAFQRAHPEVPRELLSMMVRSGFVVSVAEWPFLEHGFLKPVANPIGGALAWADLPESTVPGAWIVVGVPVDMSAGGSSGARHGAAEIRKVVSGSLLVGEGDVVDGEFKRLYRGLSPLVADLGDIEADGARMDHVGARLAKVVGEVLAQGMRPMLLGGDHAITHYALARLIARDEPFGILHFDAHADLGPSRTVSHANIFGAALESPCVSSILQIGLRGIERVTPYARRVPCPKRRVISAREARQGLALRALEELPRDIPYYLTFDIDCIDAAVARETGTPLFGGLSVELALDLVDYVARTFELLGADFVEVSGPPSALNASATIAANLLQRCLIGKSPFEALSTDVYVL